MKTQLLITINDTKTKHYSRPFYAINELDAKRTISTLVNSDKESNISLHPQDFNFFIIAEYSEDSGEIITKEKQSLGNGIDYKKME